MSSCEALLVTQEDAGQRCMTKATHTFDGRQVCWLHYVTCTTGPRAFGKGTNMHCSKYVKPVEFVRARKTG